jgi:hypothetical protein
MMVAHAARNMPARRIFTGPPLHRIVAGCWIARIGVTGRR